MQNTIQNLGRLAPAAAVFCLFANCAHPVKIKEQWGAAIGTGVDLQKAEQIWTRLKNGEISSPAELDSYNGIVTESVRQIGRNWSSDKTALSSLRTRQGTVSIDVDASTIRNVGEVNYLVPADFINIRRGLRETVKVEGAGSSLIARRGKTSDDPLISENGLWFPLTAVLDLDVPARPVLHLIDPTRHSQLEFPAGFFPLEANYSAFIARDFQDRQLQILGVPAMLKYQKFEDRMGIRRISTFSPEKKAVILVHGINSSPATWNNTVNEMMADPFVREKCELWTFGYPSGAPIPFLAKELRNSVREMCEFRERNGASDPGITLVGHSMGGLLSKTLTQSSGDENWSLVFSVPHEQLKLQEKEKTVIREMFYFEPNPHVEKIIFISTPHRGSSLAERPAVKLVSDLVQMPTTLIKLSADIFNMNTGVLTPLGQQITRESSSSIDQLRSDSEFSQIFRDMPLNPAVRYYSIIGGKNLGQGSLVESSDGVVPYTSSHIDQVESELVVESDHGAHKTKKGIAEIIRILKE